MTGSLALPLWILVLVGALALWTALDRSLMPSARWFLRRRLNRIIEEVNTRLELQIPPFQQTKRCVLIDQLSYDPQLMDGLAGWFESGPAGRAGLRVGSRELAAAARHAANQCSDRRSVRRSRRIPFLGLRIRPVWRETVCLEDGACRFARLEERKGVASHPLAGLDALEAAPFQLLDTLFPWRVVAVIGDMLKTVSMSFEEFLKDCRTANGLHQLPDDIAAGRETNLDGERGRFAPIGLFG